MKNWPPPGTRLRVIETFRDKAGRSVPQNTIGTLRGPITKRETESSYDVFDVEFPGIGVISVERRYLTEA